MYNTIDLANDSKTIREYLLLQRVAHVTVIDRLICEC